MSGGTRFQLKQPTGWFAAGREVRCALELLSDAPSNCSSGSAYMPSGAEVLCRLHRQSWLERWAKRKAICILPSKN